MLRHPPGMTEVRIADRKASRAAIGVPQTDMVDDHGIAIGLGVPQEGGAIFPGRRGARGRFDRPADLLRNRDDQRARPLTVSCCKGPLSVWPVVETLLFF